MGRIVCTSAFGYHRHSTCTVQMEYDYELRIIHEDLLCLGTDEHSVTLVLQGYLE